MAQDLSAVARALGVPEARESREVAGASRRSESDAREVYGVINGRRFVARRAGDHAEWAVALEARLQPWERARPQPSTDAD